MSESPSECTDGTETATLTESDRYRILASDRRRTTLDVLRNRPTPVSLDDLAAAVARREAGTDATDESTRERVAASLHHTHLPKMDDAGILTYDAAANRVETCRRFSPSRLA